MSYSQSGGVLTSASSATGAIEIPKQVDGTNITAINNEVFLNNSNITSVTFPADSLVTEIRLNAFKNCTGLTSFTFPASLVTLGNTVFEGCTNLTSIQMTNNITTLGTGIFKGCTGLTTVTFEATSQITQIPSNMFELNGFSSITLPDSLTSISSEAFKGNDDLTSIRIPPSVTTVGTDAFTNCTALTTINLGSTSLSPADQANNPMTLSSISNVPVLGSIQVFTTQDNADHITNNTGFPLKYRHVYAAGAGGDPYVKALNGEFYKLENKNGSFRMLQGTYFAKKFIMNVEMKIDNEKTEKEMNTWSKSLSEFNDVHKETSTDQFNQSFFTKVFIQYDTSKVLFDIDNFNIEYISGEDIEFTEKEVFSGSSIIEMYQTDKNNRLGVFKIGDIEIYVRLYDNKQIRNEIVMANHNLLKERFGFLNTPMRLKYCNVKKINNGKMLGRVNHKQHFKKQVQNKFFTYDPETTNMVRKNITINSF